MAYSLTCLGINCVGAHRRRLGDPRMERMLLSCLTRLYGLNLNPPRPAKHAVTDHQLQAVDLSSTFTDYCLDYAHSYRCRSF